jgi:nucleoside-diphosphate-sugar epimerase
MMFRTLLLLALVSVVMALRTVVVVGASGLTGREAVFQALGRGYRVAALVRTPSKLTVPDRVASLGGQPFTSPNLLCVQGDVTAKVDVEKLYAAACGNGNEVVGTIVSLGGKTKDVGKTMLEDGTRNVIETIKAAKAGRRISVVTSIGAGDSENQAPFAFKILMMSIFNDKNAQERLFVDPSGPGHDLDWCMVRPGGLGVGEPTGIINVIDGTAGSIQRSDVASFALGAVVDEGFEYIRKTPCISSVGGVGWKKEPEKGFDGVKTA